MDSEIPQMDTDELSASSSSDTSRYQHLIEHVQDAVVEFELHDGEPVIRSVNQAFEAIFGYEDVTGARLNSLIVPPWLSQEAKTLDERTGDGQVNYRRVRRQTTEGMREFLYRGVPDGPEASGGIAVYTDLTVPHRRERRLEVLNRLLRHNIRNSLTVVAGAAEEIQAEGDNEAAASLIESGTNDLLKLSEEAADIQRTLSESLPENPMVDCVEIVEGVVESARECYPLAEVQTALPAKLSVRATDRLGPAVEALVENAIVHCDGEARVYLSVERICDGEWVDLRIADNGAGIPAAERAVITGDADITATQHGSGLGLWLVKWTVERYGGSLFFEESDAGGTLVRLRLFRGS